MISLLSLHVESWCVKALHWLARDSIAIDKLGIAWYLFAEVLHALDLLLLLLCNYFHVHTFLSIK